MGCVYGLSGEREKAEQIINVFIERRTKGDQVESGFIAVIYASMGENDKAFKWLEKAYEDRDRLLTFIKADFEWDNIRSDPRFNVFLKKMGLPTD